MSMINKIVILGHILTGSFVKINCKTETLTKEFCHTYNNNIQNNQKRHLEYILIKINSTEKINFHKTIVEICINKKTFIDELNGFFLNKIYPYKFLNEMLYNNGTNNLLKDIILNKDINNIFFCPIIHTKNGIFPFDKVGNITLKMIFDKLSQFDVDIILSFANKNINNIPMKQLFTMTIDHGINKVILDKISTYVYTNITRNGDLVDYLYLHFCYDYRNYNYSGIYDDKILINPYKIIKNIKFTFGGKHMLNIPISYLNLYNKVFYNLNLNTFISNKECIIPIPIKKLTNLSYFFLNTTCFQYHDFYICYEYSTIDCSNPSEKSSENSLVDKNLTTKPINNYICKYLWINIFNFVDDQTWINLKRTCKYLYNLSKYSDHTRFNKYSDLKVNINFCSTQVDYSTINWHYTLCNNERHLKRVLKITEYLDNMYSYYTFRDINHFKLPINYHIVGINLCDKNKNAYFQCEKIEWIIIDLNLIHVKNYIKKIIAISNDNKQIIINQDNFTGSINNKSEFEQKMHNLNENRFLLKFDNIISKNIHSLIIEFDKKFCELMNAEIDIYVAYQKVFDSNKIQSVK